MIRGGHEVFGFYRGGTLALAAPDDPHRPAILTRQNRVVLATGSSSIPPLVPGNRLPGVIDARTALHLAEAGAVDDVAVVVGTGLEDKLARMLDSFGIRVAAVRPVASLSRIEGQDRVRAALFGRDRISCGLVIMPGPWIADDTLWYQLVADGELQLACHDEQAAAVPVQRVGNAALPAEPVHVPPGRIDSAHVCPCMDVTVGEIRHALGEGHSDPEVIKRLTSCGMGPCQGFPCWRRWRPSSPMIPERWSRPGPAAARRTAHHRGPGGWSSRIGQTAVMAHTAPQRPLPRSASVIIVGGGIRAAAYNLAAEHRFGDVLVLDAGYWQGRRLGTQRLADPGAFRTPEWTGLFRYSAEQWRGLSKRIGHNVMFSQRGYTMVAEKASTAHTLREARKVHAELGIPPSSFRTTTSRGCFPRSTGGRCRGRCICPTAGLRHTTPR
jgi:hypothetical protein